jgi:hypothetical protein
MDFSQVEAEFQRLKGQFEAGALTETEFKAQLKDLMAQDEQGRWWMIGYETGQWYYNDGEKWVRSEPPQVTERRREQVEALCQEGASALAAGDWGVAVGKFEAALALEPGHPEATKGLADAKARAEAARRPEVRREPEAPPVPPARTWWVWVGVGVIGLILGVIFIQSGILSGPGPGPQVEFWAAREVIAPGECTTLHWNVPGVDWVILYGHSSNDFFEDKVPHSGEMEFCQGETVTYEMKTLDREVIATIVVEVR